MNENLKPAGDTVDTRAKKDKVKGIVQSCGPILKMSTIL